MEISDSLNQLATLDIVPSKIINFLVLGTEEEDSMTFLKTFISKISDAQVSIITSAMSMATVAVQWGTEILCVNLTKISSSARLTSSSTFAYERADGIIFVTSTPSIDNVQILTRWKKEINSRTKTKEKTTDDQKNPGDSIRSIFVIQGSPNQKMQEKAATPKMIEERGFDKVMHIPKLDPDLAKSVVIHLIYFVMGKRPTNLTSEYGILLAAASKASTKFGNLF